MKGIIQFFVVVALYCFLSAGAALAASGNTAGAGAKASNRTTRGVMPEMLLYEAAEQAVEDGYAHIIPDVKGEKPGEGIVNNNKTTEDGSGAPEEKTSKSKD